MAVIIDINKKIFKANDIRGRYPEEINEEAAKFIAVKIKKIFQHGKVVVVARDTRLSSPALYKAVIRGLQATSYKALPAGRQVQAIKVGMATTPMFYFLVNHFKAAGGIMVTASHNPKNYNGLKIVGKAAAPISGTDILKIINEK